MAGIPEVKRFFREAGDINVDKSDIARFRAFVDEKIDDIAVSARDTARWNNRDVIAPQDLPITKGLQERIREFGKLETAGDMRDWIGQTLRRPPYRRATPHPGLVAAQHAEPDLLRRTLRRTEDLDVQSAVRRCPRMQAQRVDVAGGHEHRHVARGPVDHDGRVRPRGASTRVDVGECPERQQRRREQCRHDHRRQHTARDLARRGRARGGGGTHGGVPYHSHGAPIVIVDVVVAAGGKGRRLGGAVPKQWLSIGDRTIFERSVAACAASPRVRGIVVVVPDGDVEHARALARRGRREVAATWWRAARGGRTRWPRAWPPCQATRTSCSCTMRRVRS